MHSSSLKDHFPPLPVPVNPLPWEDIASLITRVAKEMDYPYPTWVLQPENPPYKIRALAVSMLHKIEDYRFLERLLMLDEATLYMHTFHFFAPQFQELEASLTERQEDIQRPLLTIGTVKWFFHTPFATKICPKCLAEDEVYGRLYWHIRPVVACLRHNNLLLDCCTVCRRHIPILRPSLTSCPHCKGDYRIANTIHMPEEVGFRVGQEMILHYLKIEAMQLKFLPVEFTQSPLLNLRPWQYFRLLQAFRFILGPLFPDESLLQVSPELRTFLRRLPHQNSRWSLPEWTVLITTFHFIFASWPNNYFTFLDTISHLDSEKSTRIGVLRDFRAFYNHWLYDGLSDPAFSFLRTGFEEYLDKYYIRGRVNHNLRPFLETPIESFPERPYLTLQQAWKMLGVCRETVDALIDQGLISVVESSMRSDGKRYHCLLLRESVEAIRHEWKTLLSLETVARSLLGISPEKVLALMGDGLLIPIRGRNVDGFRQYFYRASVVEKFIIRLLDCTDVEQFPGEESIPLSRATGYFGNILSFTTMLIEVFNGRLKPVDTGSDQPLFHRLRLPHREIARFLEDRRTRIREELGLLTTREAALYLNISENSVQILVRKKFLEKERFVVDGNRPHLMFRREALEIFLATYVFSKTEPELLGLSPRLIQKLKCCAAPNPL